MVEQQDVKLTSFHNNNKNTSTCGMIHTENLLNTAKDLRILIEQENSDETRQDKRKKETKKESVMGPAHIGGRRELGKETSSCPLGSPSPAGMSPGTEEELWGLRGKHDNPSVAVKIEIVLHKRSLLLPCMPQPDKTTTGQAGAGN